MKEKEYLRYHKQIQDKYHESMESLNKLWAATNEGINPPKPKSAQKPKKARNKGEVTLAVERAIAEIAWSSFTVNHLQGVIENLNPQTEFNKTTLSHTLRRLAESETLIRVLEVGAGKKPTMYEKVNIETKENGANGQTLPGEVLTG